MSSNYMLYPFENGHRNKLSVFKYSSNNQKVELCTIDLRKAEIITEHIYTIRVDKFVVDSIHRVGFGTKLIKKNEKVQLSFYKILADSKTSYLVTSIPLSYNLDMYKIEDLYEDSMYYCLNQRYSLFFLRKANHQYGQPFFQEVFLIDSEENTSYRVDPKMPSVNDTMTRLDGLGTFLVDDCEYFYIKTGRIRWYEKWDMWKHTESSNPYFDHLETISVFQMNHFVSDIHNSLPLKGTYIEKVDYNYAIKEIDFQNGKLCFIVDSIAENKSVLKRYCFDTQRIIVERNKAEIENYTLRRKVSLPIFNELPTTSFIDSKEYWLKISSLTKTIYLREVSLNNDQ